MAKTTDHFPLIGMTARIAAVADVREATRTPDSGR